MSPIGPVAAGGDSIIEHVNRRSYPFTLLPAQKFQTFTTPSITLTPPYVRFSSGATVESSKLYEAAIEQIDAANGLVIPVGPSGSSGANYLTSFDCIMHSTVTTPANMDSAGFMGIELYTQAIDTLVNDPTYGCVQLKWQLKDPTQWMLSVYLGSGVPGKHIPFSIPASQASGGHKVRLLWDPYSLVTSAYVDDVLLAKQSIAGINITADGTWTTAAGILIMNGNITGAPGIKTRWMGAEIATYDFHTIGAGVFDNV